MYDKTYSRGIPTGTGPDVLVVPLNLPSKHGTLKLEAWGSIQGASNVHLLDGEYDLGRAQEALDRGPENILLTLAGHGTACRLLPEDCQQITVFFEGANGSGQYQVCQFRIHD